MEIINGIDQDDSPSSGSSVHSVWLPAEAAYFPETNPAAFVEIPGASVQGGFSYLAFDDTTSENAFWRIPMSDYDGGDLIVTSFSKVATTPIGAVTLQYGISTIGLANSDAFDSVFLVSNEVKILHSLNTTELLADIIIASATIIPPDVVADDFLVIRINRDVANDNLPGDGKLLGIMLKYNRL